MFPEERRAANPAFLAVLFALLLSTGFAFAGDDWQPISPDELHMTAEPKAPGAPAIYLYRQVDRNDQEYREFVYARIKILTEEGRKYGNVEIPFLKGEEKIRNLRARTVHPDGSVLNFEGKPYEKTIVKAKGVKFLALTFAMPEVQAGSIIEYRYLREFPEGWVSDSRWILSDDLFTKHAKFSLHLNNRFAVQWSWPSGLPPGTQPPQEDHHTVRLETQDVPAFETEDFMPPPEEMKFRVEFQYASNYEKDPDRFWSTATQIMYTGVSTFIDKKKAMDEAISQMGLANDAPEVKLRKIYARVQQIRNLSYEREKSEKEQNRQKLQPLENVEDVWKKGYGNGRQINWLFLALARSAGFEASPVFSSSRARHFFRPQLMNVDQLTSSVVLVVVDGKNRCFDPGTKFAPFGLQPWSISGVPARRLDKDGGSWFTTEEPSATESRVERKATLHLTDDGSLEGDLTVTYSGLEAMWRRADEIDEDDAGRKKFLEDQVKEYVPVKIEAQLTNTPDWNSAAPTLVAKYEIKIPGWVTSAGRHSLLGAGIFGGSERKVFEHANRTYPIYFSFPYQNVDDVTIDLPAGWKVENLPPAKHVDVKALVYDMKVASEDGKLQFKRELTVNLGMAESKYYESLRTFFQNVRSSDDQQAVLSTSGTT